MTVLHIKSHNKEMLWKSLQNVVHKYGQNFDIRFEKVCLVLAHLSDVLNANRVMLNLLKESTIKIIDQKISDHDRKKLDFISRKFQIHFVKPSQNPSHQQNAQSDFSLSPLLFYSAIFLKILGAVFIGCLIIKVLTPHAKENHHLKELH